MISNALARRSRRSKQKKKQEWTYWDDVIAGDAEVPCTQLAADGGCDFSDVTQYDASEKRSKLNHICQLIQGNGGSLTPALCKSNYENGWGRNSPRLACCQCLASDACNNNVDCKAAMTQRCGDEKPTVMLRAGAKVFETRSPEALMTEIDARTRAAMESKSLSGST